MERTFCNRLFAILLALALLLSAAPAVEAESGNGDFEIEGTTLIKYTGSDEEVIVPDGIEVLGEWAFDSRQMKSVVLPESLKEISSYCFFSCKQLEEIMLPASVKKISDAQAFAWCRSLRAINVAEGNESFVSVDGVLYTKDLSTLMYYPDGREADVYEIPEGTTRVCNTAFGFPKIGKIVIPASLTVMEPDALDEVLGLKEIEVGEGNPNFISRDGVLCSEDGKTLCCYPDGREQDTLAPEDFPEGTEILGTASFSRSVFRKIILPDTVKKVGWRAFADSEQLEELVIPASVEEIGNRAFEYCPSLKTIYILNGNAALPEADLNNTIADRSENVMIVTPAGGTVEAYCRDCNIFCLGMEPTAEGTAAQVADWEKDIVRLRAEAEARQAENAAAAREQAFQDSLEDLRRSDEEADAAWQAAWPPEDKKQAASVKTYSDSMFINTFYIDPDEIVMEEYPGYGRLHSFAPFYLTGEDESEEEQVLGYHVTFLSGDEHLRGFYYNGQYGSGEAAINLNWQHIFRPGTAKYRIDMVSEHYWASQEVDVEIADVNAVSVELVSADAYIPVGEMITIGELFDLREYVKTEPRKEYRCSVNAAGSGNADTEQYELVSWNYFTAKQPGDYPMTLCVSIGEGFRKEFPITVHASAETTTAYVEGDAPLTMKGERREREEQERLKAEEERQKAEEEEQRAKEEKQQPDGILLEDEPEIQPAEPGTKDATGKWTYRLQEDNTAVICGYAYTSKLVFPSEVDGYPVTVIERTQQTEGKIDKVTQVVIPEGVREIGENAFRNMTKLNKLKLPSTLKKIGRNAFARSALTELVLPAGLEEIGDAAFVQSFYAKKSISKVTFNGAATRLGKGLFGYDDGYEAYRKEHAEEIEKGTAPKYDHEDPENWKDYYAENTGSKPKEISITCFPGSTADRTYRYHVKKNYLSWSEENILTAPADKVLQAGLITADDRIYELIIPEGVEEIADNALAGSNLSKVHLPSTLKKIGSGAFEGCIALTELALPEGVTEIGQSAFKDCAALKQINLPDGITEIPDHAFDGCVSLAKLKTAKTGLKRIGESAFYNCKSLGTAPLPAGLEEIGDLAFSISGITKAVVPDSVTKLGYGAFFGAKITALTLPKGLTEIPDMLCMTCTKLKSVKIPDSVTRIGSMAFMNCISLTQINLPEGLVSIGQQAFYLDPDTVMMVYMYSGGKQSLSKVKSLKLPASLQEIGDGAFACQDALKTVTFARGSQLREIGDQAFAICMSLKEISLPDSVKSIGEQSFANCISLKKVTLGSSLEKAGNGAFYFCKDLAELTVPDTLTEIGTGLLEKHGSKLKVTCGEGSAMEKYLQENAPDVKIVYPKKK